MDPCGIRKVFPSLLSRASDTMGRLFSLSVAMMLCLVAWLGNWDAITLAFALKLWVEAWLGRCPDAQRYKPLPHCGSQTILKSTSLVCGTTLSTLERVRASAYKLVSLDRLRNSWDTAVWRWDDLDCRQVVTLPRAG